VLLLQTLIIINQTKQKMNFDELGLSAPVIAAIKELGFETPTPIQQQTIPMLLNKKTDLVALAQTGTGKTAAFGLPLIEQIDVYQSHVQAIILSPTRELGMQIGKDIERFTKNIHGFKTLCVYGGTSIVNQIKDLKRGVHVVVATPGRLVDLIDRKAIDLSRVQIAILDEADEMLNMGFKDDLDAILKQTPKTKNTWLFSATMPSEVLRISKNYMNDPEQIQVGTKNQGAENIEHHYYVVQARDRYLALKSVLDFYPEIYGICFCKTKMETQEVADALIKDGYNADALHGDLSQTQRDLVMKRYRHKALQILVATDVAARGIDVSDITHVINYNLPDESENYTHRSGRTARAGKKGISLAIVNMRELGKIRTIENIIKRKFEKKEVPSGHEICEKQLFHLVDKIHNTEVNDPSIDKYLPKIYESLIDLSKEELIKRFVADEFYRFNNYYKNANDLNAKGDNGSRSRDNGSNGMVRFFINIGEMDDLTKPGLANVIADKTGVKFDDIKRIELRDKFSFFETEPAQAAQIEIAFANNLEYNNRRLSLEVAKARDGGSDNNRSRSRDRGGYRGERGGSDNYRNRGGDRSRGGSDNFRRGNDRGGSDSFRNRGERNSGRSSDRPERRERESDFSGNRDQFKKSFGGSRERRRS
jgi:ATP-dependent RNA helicase DeaD